MPVELCCLPRSRYNQGTPSGGHLEKAFREYWQNLDTLLGKLKEVLPTDCLVIWDTAMPLGQEVQHAYLETGVGTASPRLGRHSDPVPTQVPRLWLFSSQWEGQTP